MIRRYGNFPKASCACMYRPGSYGILLRGDKVLLTHQASPNSDFQLPGGGIDPGESPIAALHREVMEETGWRLARPQLVTHFKQIVFMPEYDTWAEKICHIFVARPIACLGPPIEPEHSAVWVPAEYAPDLILGEGSRAVLQSALRRRKFQQNR